MNEQAVPQTFTRVIDNRVYSRKAIAESTAAYREFCVTRISRLGDDRAELTIEINVEHEKQAREIVLSFFNYALDLSCQIHLAQDGA